MVYSMVWVWFVYGLQYGLDIMVYGSLIHARTDIWILGSHPSPTIVSLGPQ